MGPLPCAILHVVSFSPHTITSILQVRTLRLREIKQVAQLSSFSQSWNMIKLRLELAVPS